MLVNRAILTHRVKGTDQTQGEMLMAVNPGDPLLIPPILDAYDEYLMYVFQQLDRDRPSNMSGPGLFTLQSLMNYSELFSDTLSPAEINTLQQLDVVYLTKKYELNKE